VYYKELQKDKRKNNKDGLAFLGSIPGDEQPLDSIDHLVRALEKYFF
jgi:hypothetical protein